VGETHGEVRGGENRKRGSWRLVVPRRGLAGEAMCGGFGMVEKIDRKRSRLGHGRNGVKIPNFLVRRKCLYQ